MVLIGTVGYLTVHRGGGSPATPGAHRPSTACPPSRPVEHPDAPLTPYPGPVPADRFLQGATVDLADTTADDLPHLLDTMRSAHHINTITVYGLERWDAPGSGRKKDLLFAELARRQMKIVIRLEAYDTVRFAFRSADVDPVLDAHLPLLRYLADPQRRDRVAYLQLNMPVDDPGVQRRLGGVNSAVSVDRQVSYAAALVRRTRAALGGHGTPVYLGLFYGWDNTYQPPSYAAAGADGYVLTNYSYPAGVVPDGRADDRTLINEPRLRVAVDRALAQYGDRAPLVVEYGFHTAARHRGVLPDQRAGLVADTTAKRRALRATNRLYCDSYPSVRGTMYFGFNVVKTEGDPPAELDFTLLPATAGPSTGQPS